MRRAAFALVAASCAAVAAACSLLTPVDDLLAKDSGAPDVQPIDSGVPDVVLDVQPADTGPDAGCGTMGPTSRLVGYWPMDEGQGTKVHDCTSNHLDGTFVALPDGGLPWTQGRVGGAIAVTDGPAGCVDIPLPPTIRLLDAWSVSAWMNVASYGANGNYGYLVSHNKASPAAGTWRVATLAPQSVEIAGAWDGGNLTLAGAGPAVMAWTHVAAVFRPGAAVELYVNGQVVAARTTNVPMAFLDDMSGLRIGCRGDGQLPLHGAVDEVRVYASALSIADIAALAQ